MGSCDSPSLGLLEWELSLPSEKILSHGWYHGSITRATAESLLQQDRQFLVRNSSSQPENYVLSCMSNRQHLHFVIQRIVVLPNTVYERYKYQFEDEAYDTVADLITSYVGSGKPISAASGARIQYPCNRFRPLTDVATSDNPTRNITPPVGDGGNHGNQQSLYSHITANSGVQSRIPFNKQRSHSLTPIDMNQHANPGKSASADGVIQAQSNHTVAKKSSSESKSDSATWDTNTSSSPPAKPARYDGPKADDRRLEIQRLYQVSGSDSGNGSGDSTQSFAHGNPHTSRTDSDYSLATPTVNQQFDYDLAEARILQLEDNDYTVESRIGFYSVHSHIILSDFPKPLDTIGLQTIKRMLRSVGSLYLATHLTSIDAGYLLREVNQIRGLDKDATILELCFLPQGTQLRMDIIERIETFRLLVAVTILTCSSDDDRADTLNDWITLAVETKTACGNLYGFASIMFGLCMPQVECLENAWNILRREHTETAFMFESKLRPCFKSMNEGTNPLPPNTCTPYLLPSVLCFHSLDGETCLVTKAVKSFSASLYHKLEFDFHATAAHLESARLFPQQIEMFKRNARPFIQKTSNTGGYLDPPLLELFSTEFHINFLWGGRGALTMPHQRFARMYDILLTMANKLSGPVRDED